MKKDAFNSDNYYIGKWAAKLGKALHLTKSEENMRGLKKQPSKTFTLTNRAVVVKLFQDENPPSDDGA
jgi:hypothetical protein